MATVTVGQLQAILRMRDEMSPVVQKQQMSLKGLGREFLSIAGPIIGFGAAVRGATAALEAQSKQEAAVNALNLALANQGNLADGTSERLREYASALQQTTTFGDEVILQAQSLLASFGMNEEQLKATTGAALDFAAVTGNLEAAAKLLGKAFVGETGELSRYGIIIDKNIPKSEKFAAVLDQLNQRFGGQAQAQAATYAGQIEQLKNAYGDAQEALGRFIQSILSMGDATKSGVGFAKTLETFFGVTLIRALAEARALFAELVSGVLFGFSRLAEGLEKIPFIGKKIAGEWGDTLRTMAVDQQVLAEDIRKTAEASIAAGGSFQHYTNAAKVATTATEDNSKALKSAEKALKDMEKAGQDALVSMVSLAGGGGEGGGGGIAGVTDELDRLLEPLDKLGPATFQVRREFDALVKAVDWVNGPKGLSDQQLAAYVAEMERLGDAGALTTEQLLRLGEAYEEAMRRGIIATETATASLGTTLLGTLKASAAKMPDIIVGALQGGGDVFRSIGAQIGGDLGNVIGKAVGPALNSILGETLGATLSGLIPGLSSLFGGALGGLLDKGISAIGDFFGDLFGGKSDVSKARDAFFAQFEDGFIGVQRLLVGTIGAVEQQDFVKQLFDAKTVEEFLRIVQKIRDTLAGMPGLPPVLQGGTPGGNQPPAGGSASGGGPPPGGIPGGAGNPWSGKNDDYELGYQHGSGWTNFGAGTPAVLHGVERVQTPAQAAAESGAVVAELRALRREFRELRGSMARAVRDGFLLSN